MLDSRSHGLEARVFDAVERLLADGHRFDDLGVQRIASEAGVARSTFYVHFRDRSDLLVRLAERVTEPAFTALSRWVDAGTDGVEGLERTLVVVVAAVRAHLPVLHALSEAALRDPAVDELWSSRIDGLAAALQLRLLDERNLGELPSDVDPELLAQNVAWSLERNVARHVRRMRTADPVADARFASGLADATWRSLYGRVAAV